MFQLFLFHDQENIFSLKGEILKINTQTADLESVIFFKKKKNDSLSYSPDPF